MRGYMVTVLPLLSNFAASYPGPNDRSQLTGKLRGGIVGRLEQWAFADVSVRLANPAWPKCSDYRLVRRAGRIFPKLACLGSVSGTQTMSASPAGSQPSNVSRDYEEGAGEDLLAGRAVPDF
jgi:hypothetical protein